MVGTKTTTCFLSKTALYGHIGKDKLTFNTENSKKIEPQQDLQLLNDEIKLCTGNLTQYKKDYIELMKKKHFTTKSLIAIQNQIDTGTGLSTEKRNENKLQNLFRELILYKKHKNIEDDSENDVKLLYDIPENTELDDRNMLQRIGSGLINLSSTSTKKAANFVSDLVTLPEKKGMIEKRKAHIYPIR